MKPAREERQPSIWIKDQLTAKEMMLLLVVSTSYSQDTKKKKEAVKTSLPASGNMTMHSKIIQFEEDEAPLRHNWTMMSGVLPPITPYIFSDTAKGHFPKVFHSI